jgi:GT2 family glycosyltransferase
MGINSIISSQLIIFKDLKLINYFHYLKTKFLSKFFFQKPVLEIFPKAVSSQAYDSWIKINHTRKSDLIIYAEVIKILEHKPLISIIMPVYNPPIEYLKAAVNSVISQVYTNWELCIADDFSTEAHVRKVLDDFVKQDRRIKVRYRSSNGHISEASNTAVEMANGDFIALLDQDDLLTSDALFQNVLALNLNPQIDMLYSDEDKINEQGFRFSPHFKPDWAPESLLSRNYICHFVVLKRSIVNEIGGFRRGFEGSQDYDLILRFTEKTQRIYHIPRILYHWRTHSNSTALSAGAKSYAAIAGENALKEALIRRRTPGRVNPLLELPGNFNIIYDIEGTPRVSIIIPSKNQFHFVSNCLDSIFKKTTFTNFEVIFIDNGSNEDDVLSLLQFWEKNEPIRFKRYIKDISFNFSELINYGREKATGNFLILLNNDTEIISEDWIESLLNQAQRSEIGAVGCKLIFLNKTIQHAGVLLGVGGIANHAMLGEYKDTNKHFCYLKLTNNVSAVTGACLMVETNKFDLVGGFDENLAIAFNDIDFCLKLFEQGYRNLYLPYVTLYHFESKSRGKDISNEKRKRLENESSFMKEKWKGLIERDSFYNINLTNEKMDFSLNL